MDPNWHSMKIEDLNRNLKTGPGGLSREEAERRLKEFGFNELREIRRVTALRIFLGQFKDIFVIMLLAAILISVLVGEMVDALTISAIVVLNAVVGFVQEYRSEKAMEAMKKLTAPKARIIRDGKETLIPAREVVPGDAAILEAGDRIPADGRLLEAIDLKTDEAVLTGESTPVEKKAIVVKAETPVGDRKNMVFMATHTTYGRGKAVITSTGMSTEFGKIAEMVQTIEEEEPPLKLKLRQFAKKLGIIIVIVCAVIFLLEVVRFLLGASGEERISEMFLIPIALAVSAVPEGLPAIVTVTLALGARELARRNAVIRRLSSAETLGSTTIICSDKTGTLTKGEMTVRKIYVNDEIIGVTGVGYESKGEFYRDKNLVDPKEDVHLNLLLRIGTLCNNAKYEEPKIIGDPTEGALIVAAAKAGILQDATESKYPRLDEIPFSSERKRMTTIHRTPEGELVAYVKGAPETILERCTHVFKGGEVRRLGEREKEEILEVNDELASEALRILGTAYRDLPKTLKDFTEENVENHLIFVGLMGMIDPPREEVKEATRLCEKAGIKPVMITGDHKLTAIAIAKDIGILKSGLVLTGEELEQMSDEEFEKVIEDVGVYARVYPEQKIRIVKALKKKGHIVAMTGDGVNDAPALKRADIGVAMGISGTDVAREASDIVLTDDNFATIVNAVEGGRTIYDNIRKSSFFLLRCNFDELALIGTFALLGLKLPLTAGMILWINLVTDGGPALALTMDPPEKDVMERPPRNPNEGVLHGRMASIIATFVTQFLLTGGLFYWQYYMLPGPLTELKLAQARTMAFIRATLQELFVVWNCRSEKRNAFRVEFLSNKFLLVAVVISGLLTILVPFIGLFGTVVLDDPIEWAIAIIASLSGLLILPEIFYGRKIWRWT